MARKPSRTPSPAPTEEGSDVEEPTEMEIPISDGEPSRRRVSKRRSKVNVDDGADGSSIKRKPSMPKKKSTTLAEIDINDDQAERRRRRKSTRVSFVDPLVGLQDRDNEDGEGPSDPSAAAALDGEKDASGQLGPRTPRASLHGKGGQLNTINHTPMPTVSMDVMSSNFEEWMKMATDNVSHSAQSQTTTEPFIYSS